VAPNSSGGLTYWKRLWSHQLSYFITSSPVSSEMDARCVTNHLGELSILLLAGREMSTWR